MEQGTLFTTQNISEPLAARLRPTTLEEYVGQTHLIGKGKVLRRLIEGDQISSMIFWGPPGVGKTTLARIIANTTHSTFIDFSAVTSGIKDIRTKSLRSRNPGNVVAATVAGLASVRTTAEVAKLRGLDEKEMLG